jgi:hypothetical protein
LEKVEPFGKAVAALEKAAGEATAMVQRNHAANMLECVSKNEFFF